MYVIANEKALTAIYVAALREFPKKFGIHRNSKVPSAHAIKTRVNNFEDTGSAVKKKGGSVT